MDKNKEIKTVDEARQYAIEWQQWAGDQNVAGEEPTLYQSDLAEWAGIFTKLGEKFGLTEEFIENGII